MMAGRPDGYSAIPAHKESIEEARETKQSLGLTWNDYLELSAKRLSDETDEQND